MNALVIDEEVQIRRFVGALLRDEEWTVSEAESAEQNKQLHACSVSIVKRWNGS